MKLIQQLIPVYLLLTVVLSGCATTNKYGSFLQNDPKAIETMIANDAVQQLIELYPPAKSSFTMKHEPSGHFCMILVKALRNEGYAIKEYTKKADKTTSIENGLDFRYILDVAGTPNIYRLTLMVGEETISRPYVRKGTDIIPAGYWARKE